MFLYLNKKTALADPRTPQSLSVHAEPPVYDSLARVTARARAPASCATTVDSAVPPRVWLGTNTLGQRCDTGGRRDAPQLAYGGECILKVLLVRAGLPLYLASCPYEIFFLLRQELMAVVQTLIGPSIASSVCAFRTVMIYIRVNMLWRIYLYTLYNSTPFINKSQECEQLQSFGNIRGAASPISTKLLTRLRASVLLSAKCLSKHSHERRSYAPWLLFYIYSS